MVQRIQELLAIPELRAAAIVVGSIVAAFIVRLIGQHTLSRMARATQTDVDDKLIDILQRPVFVTALIAGVYWASQTLHLHLGSTLGGFVRGSLLTFATVLWALAIARIGGVFLKAMAHQRGRGGLVQPTSVPLLAILFKLMVVLIAIYVMFLVWRIDLTAWLASAGIAGIAIGFGAKDTLSNLFAGIFIIADAPYKAGDFIVLEDGLRGRVTHIGMRSTRILTLDDTEITVPNGLIGNSRIVNESGGPHLKQRLKIEVSVAYGSDIDQVTTLLLSCLEGVPHVSRRPAPEVRLAVFGGSGLDMQLLVYIEDAAQRERLRDRLHRGIYKTLNEAGVEIPYSKHDVYLKGDPFDGALKALEIPPAPSSRPVSDRMSGPY